VIAIIFYFVCSRLLNLLDDYFQLIITHYFAPVPCFSVQKDKISKAKEISFSI